MTRRPTYRSAAMLAAALGGAACMVQHPDFVEPGADAGTGLEGTSSDETSTDGSESGTTTGGDDEATSDSTETGTPDSGQGDGAWPDTPGQAGQPHRLFVSSGAYPANLSSAQGADAVCQTLAANAGLQEANWHAIISEPELDARDRLVLDRPIENMIGEQVAENGEDLFDGTLDSPVHFDEDGIQQFGRAWTGTSPNGTAVAETCEAWTLDSAGSGRSGNIASLFGTWLAGSTQPCGKDQHLYCISQPG